jgi:hypothetical protein
LCRDKIPEREFIMAKMTATEMNTYVKAEAVKTALNLEGATRIDDFTWAVPVEIDGENGKEIRYAKIAVTAALAKATKANPAFDLDTAVAAYEEKKAERAAKKAEAEAKKLAKNAK